MSRPGEDAQPVLDLRTYKLAPGGREEFERVFRDALQMLAWHRIQVVGYGPSLVDDDHYYLARAFPSAAARDEQLGGFYGSEEWKENYRASVLRLVEAYHVIVIPGTSLGTAESR